MHAQHTTTHRLSCLASLTATLQGTKDTLGESFSWQQAPKHTKVTYHRASQPPARPSRLYPAEGTFQRTTQCISENRKTVPAASADVTSQEITLYFSSPAQPFFSGPLANLQEKCMPVPTTQSMATSKTQACDRSCNFGTAKGRNEAYYLSQLPPFP